MKQIILLLACMLATTTSLFADDDKPITVEQLPVNSRQFIEQYFPGAKVSYAKKDKEIFDKSYEVIFVDGSKVEFDKKGEWKDVDCKFAEVPTGIIPQKIREYITANYPNIKPIEIDRDNRDYEVKLSNGLELKFDLKYNIVGIDN